jgi:hypothetical protein
MRRSASSRDAALLEPVQALRLRRFDDDHRAVLEAALGLDEQGTSWTTMPSAAPLRLQELLADRRVRDRLEILLRFVGSECPFGEGGPVERAVRLQDLAPGARRVARRGRPRLHDLPRDEIRVDDATPRA